MRTGKNPAKTGLPAYSPNKLGVAIILYIPFTEGYFEHSLKIFRYQVESLRAATTQPFDLLVYDNGSCPEVVAELQSLRALGWIDWLLLSRHNMGKAGAWNWIFSAMPNKLICYADSDVLFRPGWLEASLEVLEAFPQAGMVAAQPNFFDVMEGKGQAHEALRQDENFVFGEYRPAQEIVEEYCLGINADEELAERFRHTPLPAVTNRAKNIQAVLGASHMQFIIPRQAARQVTPLPATRGLLRKETMSLDYRTDELGYLHLSVLKPFVFHMGNTVNEQLVKEIAQITGNPSSQHSASLPDAPLARKPARKPSPAMRWAMALSKQPRFQRLFLRLYDFLFRVLYSEGQKR
jgi:hypothetical protein